MGGASQTQLPVSIVRPCAHKPTTDALRGKHQSGEKSENQLKIKILKIKSCNGG